jgi:copper chaperone NosL
MTIKSRLLQAFAALLLAPTFLLPLWSIGLVAPQYNDGLGMYIGLRDIWGHQPFDIQNINILNHYIGMMPIQPEEVDVLRIMPWAVGVLILAGLLVAAVGRRWLVAAWLGLFAVLGTAGLYEFYSWQHMYGHNLDPMAPIKVPGMTYQPPFIGSKTLLNITASSWPSWGTLFIALSFVVGVAAFLATTRGASSLLRPAARRGTVGGAAAAAVLAVIVAGCGTASAGAEAAEADRTRFAGQGEASAYCEGVIPDTRFGGEIVTRGGDVYRFMSVECLAGFVAEGRVSEAEIASMTVVDYNRNDLLIDARTARYVRMDWETSPNGLNLVATETERIANNLHYFFGGVQLDWAGVLEYVRREWEL